MSIAFGRRGLMSYVARSKDITNRATRDCAIKFDKLALSICFGMEKKICGACTIYNDKDMGSAVWAMRDTGSGCGVSARREGDRADPGWYMLGHLYIYINPHRT